MTYGSEMKDYEADQNQIVTPEEIPISGFYKSSFTVSDIKHGPAMVQCKNCRGKSIVSKSQLEDFKCICQRVEQWPAKGYWVCRNGHHNFTDIGMEMSRFCNACDESHKKPLLDLEKKRAVLKAGLDRVKQAQKKQKLDKIKEKEDEIKQKQKEKEKQERIEEQAEAYFIALKRLENSKLDW